MVIEIVKQAEVAGIHLYLEDGKLKFKARQGAMTPELKQQIVSAKQEIISFLSNRPSPKNDNKRYPVSFSQQRLWFIDAMQGSSVEYNMPMALSVKGHLDLEVLTRVCEHIIARHEVLRSVYVEHETQAGVVQQQVLPMSAVTFRVQEQDFRGLSVEAQQQAVAQAIKDNALTGFDLSKDLMLRVGYIHTGLAQQDGVLLFNMHHIASDGWSMALLNKEFARLYQAFSQGEASPLPALAIQYGDYAHWQRTHLEGEVLERQLSYWTEQLADAPSLHSLALDYPRPETKQFAGAVVRGQLDKSVRDGLARLAKAHGLTPFMLLHGALSLVLSRHSYSEDIVIGTPVANRMQRELSELIGFFVNTLVLRVNTNHEDLGGYLAHVKQVHLDAQSNQDVPFEQLVERLQVPRSTAYTPLFQIMLTTQNDYGIDSEQESQSIGVADLELTRLLSSEMQSKFDLDVHINLNETGVLLKWTYDKSLFSDIHIQQLNDHLATLLTALSESTTHSATALKQLSLLSRQEQQQLISNHNDNARQLSGKLAINELLEQSAQRAPEQVALISAEGELTYGELNAQANRVAYYLQQHYHIQRGDIVAIGCRRSAQQLIAMLAVLKAGAAYLPVDPVAPVSRIQTVFEDAAPKLLLTYLESTATITQTVCPFVNMDQVIEQSQSYPANDVFIAERQASDDAYIIYTSGSTGKPKGVRQTHQTIINLLESTVDEAQALKTLQFTPLTFDVSVQEIHAALYSASTLVLIDETQKEDLITLADYIAELQIERLFIPPMVFDFFASQWQQKNTTTALKEVYVAGEKLELTPAIRACLADTEMQLFNHYGPTETHVCTAASIVGTEKEVTIGRAINNTSLFILQDGLLAPEGAVGELYVGGLGVANGYLNRAELTAERFVDNPYFDANNPCSSARLYRTGDLVRYRADGTLAFIGRADDQVKIRGFRIELGEVEAQVNAVEGVDSSVVRVCELAGSAQLVAYVKAQDEVSAITDSVRETLTARLPSHLVPAVFVDITEWPLTSNGKINKKALPIPDGVGLQGEYVAPSTDNERALVGIWSELLGVAEDKISANANFFELGGHSLLVVRLVAEIRARLAAELAIKAVFTAPVLSDLAALLEHQSGHVLPPIKAVERESGRLPVSFSQQRLWFIDAMQGSSVEYNMPMALSVKGHLDLEVLTRVCEHIIARHEVLRSVYVEHETQAGVVQQQVLPMSAVTFRVQEQDFRGLSVEAQQQAVAQAIKDNALTGFDLSKDLMLRVGYIHTGLAQQDGVLLFNMHHIASDGWSMALLNKEFARLYQAFSQGEASPLPALAIQYGDYAHWQRTHLEGEVLERQLSYWTEQLADAPSLHSLALDYPRPETKQFAGAVVRGQLDKSVRDGLARLAKAHGLTPFMLLHGALSLVLSRHSYSEDIVIGTPVANRMQRELSELIGFFVNTLVLRVNTNHEDLGGYLAHVKQVHLDAQSNQDVPFEQLVERLQVPRSTAYTPLFQISMTTETNYGVTQHETESQAGAGVTLSAMGNDSVQAKFDLDIHLSLQDDGVKVNWIYDTSLFSDTHIEKLNQHLCQLLKELSCVVTTGNVALNQLEMLTENEREKLLYDYNHVAIDYPTTACIHTLFEQQVQQTPDAIAVRYQEQALTYQQVNERANQLAYYLKRNFNIAPDMLVGLCVERSLEMLIGMLAILKSGGAYVPLDPSYPQERLSYLIDDAQLGVIVTQNKVSHVLSRFTGELINVEGIGVAETQGAWSEESAHNPELHHINAQNLAYVIYTSGSTGKPKGVLTPHLGVVRLVIGQRFMTLNAQTVMMQCANIAFDAATLEIWGPLLNGGQVVLYPHSELLPTTLNEEVARHCVNTLWLTAGLFREWSFHVPTDSPLEQVLAGGDVLDTSAIERTLRYLPQVQLINGYGPTENTTFSTTYQFSSSREYKLVPIGKKLSSDVTYILGLHGELVPEGAIGELYVGGDGLARGYLNRAELTAERFINNPYYDEKNRSSERLYRTGDLVRYLPEGDLAFVGRTDNQIKVRGFRVELGEIESQLGQLEAVDSALVLVREVSGSAQLIGYVKAKEQVAHECDFLTVVKAQLSEQVPEYMVPNRMVVVSDWPLTANGKVDRRALPEPDIASDNYLAPASSNEQVLTTIWSELLDIPKDKISANANFFELGGHSLLVVRLVAEIRARLAAELAIKAVFTAPVLSDLAALLEHQSGHVLPPIKAVERESGRLPVSFSQQRLWFIDAMQGSSVEYNMPMALSVKGHLDLEVLTRVCEHIIARHEVLRSVYVEHETQAGVVQQQVLPMSAVTFRVQEQDFRGLSVEAQQQAVAQAIKDNALTGFDLSKDLMLRVGYIHTGLAQQDGVLLFNMHHIASDGWSMALLNKEFARLYQAFSQGEASPLPALAIQYGDYAHWQRTHLEGEVLERQLSYWTEQLADAPSLHSLALDYPRPETKQFAGAVVRGQLDKSVRDGLARLAKAHGLTPFMLLHGALSLVLSRHSYSEDIVIGTPVANRMQRELSELIGFFVNTLVLRVNTNHEDLGGYLAHVKQVHLDAQSNQDVPFEQLVERLQVPRSTAYTPLFQISMTTETNYGVTQHETESQAGAGVTLSAMGNDSVQAKFDLDIHLSLQDDGVKVNWIYDTSLFSGAHIQQMQSHLLELLTVFAQLPVEQEQAITLTQLSMITEQERQQLLTVPNMCADSGTPKHAALQFEALAAERAEQEAVRCEGESISFAALDAQANQLAGYLKEQYQVTAGARVGLCLSRSIDMLVAIVAVWKLGAAYVPLDPTHPVTRIQDIVEDAELSVVLCETATSSLLAGSGSQSVILTQAKTQYQHYSKARLVDVKLSAEQVAYVIYTSGTTGKPKGVEVTHRNLTMLADEMDTWFDDVKKVGWCANYIFDASLQGLCFLAKGKTLSVLTETQKKDPTLLKTWLTTEQVDVLDCTPSLLSYWLEALSLSDMPHLLIGGEAIHSALWQALAAQSAVSSQCFYNVYGPTECTVNSTVTKIAGDTPHIGRALPYAQLVIAHPTQHDLVPMGCVGELYVGGLGVANGYLNRAELTAERFVDNPYFDANNPCSSARLYRTGDLVRYRADGTLAFIGRADDQVKIRGFRIELGEVEAQVNAVEGVDSSVVRVCELAGSAQLVAYVKAQDEVSAITDSVRETLTARLPSHLVPAVFVDITEWPLTSNGKINKKALPIPDGVGLQGEYVAPSTDNERALVGIWSELLGVAEDKISANANFFELGGHSLLVVRLVAEIRARLAAELAIKAVFTAPVLSDLAALLEHQSGHVLPPIKAVERESGRLPVSFSQQRLWFIDAMQGSSVEYNMPMALSVKGHLDLEVLTRVCEHIIARHEVLRSVYVEHETQAGVVQQQVLPMSAVTFRVQEQDFRGLSVEAQQQAVAQAIKDNALTGFDLSKDLMLRVGYIHTGLAQQDGVLLFNMHHIASDGWSMALLNKEFARLYQAFSQGEASPLPALAIQYGDYAHWQRTHLEGEVLERQLSYWTEQLADAPSLHSLALDYPRPETKQFAGAVVRGQLDKSVRDGLARLAKAHGLTPFMLLHGALSLVLSRHSYSEDIVIGTPVANRMQRELSELIGFFVNTLVLRVNTNHEDLGGYLAHVKQVHLDAQSNQDVPFEQLVERLQVPRSTAYTPLFQISMTTETNYGVTQHETESQAGAGVTLSAMGNDSVQAKFDLDIHLSLQDDGVKVNWIYDTSLFSGAHIQQMQSHLLELLTVFAQLPVEQEQAITLTQLSMITEQERQQLLTVPNMCADSGTPKHAALQFEALAAERAEQEAVRCEGESISFAALDAQANQLAGYLKEQYQVTAGARVGLCLSRSIDMLVAIVAVWKLGAAYVPLDPTHPVTRIQDIVEDAELSVVLCETATSSLLAGSGSQSVILTQAKTQYQHYSKARLVDVKLSAEQVAYVIYTSGTTGKPKGVEVTHRNLTMLADEMDTWFDDVKKVGWCANYIFDASLQGLCFLAKGKTLSVLTETQKKDPTLLKTWLTTEQVDVLDCTPSLLSYWLEALSLSDMPHLLIGGEAIHSALWQALAAQSAVSSQCFYNVYGPTECTVNSTVTKIAGDTPHIGRALPYAQLVIAHPTQHDLVPMGCVGELYVGGLGVANGYLNRAELTAERFVDNPYFDANNPCSSARLYRTGDLVRYRADGTLAFIGRADDQVKIRGFRIELGEVEAQVNAVEGVDSSVVRVCELAGSAQLVAYVKAQDEVSAITDSVRETLTARLPSHLVPAVFVDITEWPLTSNGKINKKALPIPDGVGLQGEYVAPSTDNERALVGIWSELLGVAEDKISANANFFELGGHSLLVVRLVAEIRARLAVNTTIQSVFRTPVLRELARQEQQVNSIAPIARLKESTHAEFSILYIPGVAGIASSFSVVNAGLNSLPCNVYAYNHRGVLDDQPAHDSIHNIVDEVISELPDKAREQKLIVVGHSFGGAVAAELHSRLKASIRTIETVLLDTFFEQSLDEVHQGLRKQFENIDYETAATSQVEKLKTIYLKQSSIFSEYKPNEQLLEQLHFIYASESLSNPDRKPFTATPYVVSGDHFSMLQAPGAHQIIKKIITL
ncbi:amino acid adenylation domain-containing protein [Pseudoalteromonas sp. T1lg65]|uniref:amino acid adenylation domain-containing protein n=1 Tax=Pseudoalteromonas sp. T1lg65 TaxID=2077101 RepID=UPI003F796034